MLALAKLSQIDWKPSEIELRVRRVPRGRIDISPLPIKHKVGNTLLPRTPGEGGEAG